MTADLARATPTPMPPNRWTEWMTIDLRALGAFRIALAFTVLVDLVDRARAFMLYTDEGPLPFALHDGPVFTLHRGPDAVVVALFVVHAIVALAFGAGWKTRMIAPVLFVLQVSLQQRCYLSIYLGDALLRAMLFWACVLPVGERFSLDSRWSRAPGALHSFASAGLALVPFTIFLFTAFEKLVSPAWRDGRALGVFLETWIFPTTVGIALLDGAPSLLPLLTTVAIVAEVVLPIMLLLPWWRARVFGAVGLFALMFGIAVMLDVGLFPLITATALVSRVPSQLWARGEARGEARGQARGQARGEPVRRRRDTPLGRALDALALAAALCMLVTSALNMAKVEIPQPFVGALQLLGLNQRWPMFTNPDHPPRGWFLIAERRADGSQWDLLEGTPLSATRIPMAASTTKTIFRERRVLHRAYLGADGYKEVTADWLCRRAARARGPLVSLNVGYAEVRGDPPNVLVIELVKDHPCPAR
jgi:hypothetical protein